jgi:hypothetical protein
VQSVLEDMVWVCDCERKGGEGGEVLGAWSELRERKESETQAAAAKNAERKRKRQAPPKKKAEKKRKLQARPASGFYGVCSTNGKGWKAQLYYDNKNHGLGTFDTNREVALRRNRVRSYASANS